MVLVTGGTGFIGAHLLLHLLKNGDNVRAIYRNREAINKTKKLFLLYEEASLFEKIEWVEADITDIPSLTVAFQEVQYVYHCAALVSFDPKDENKLRKINIEGTANMINFSLANNIEKFCYVSSIAALGDVLPNEKYITEDSEWNPENAHNDYAISKYGAEIEVWRGQQEGLSIIIVNPGVVLGPGFFNDGSGLFFSNMDKGFSFYTKGTTGFVGVDDVVKIMFDLMKSSVEGERFTLVSENVSFETVLKTIAQNLNKKAPSVYAKRWMTEMAWRCDWLVSHLFFMKSKITKAMSKSMHATDLYANEKIKNLVGFDFLPIDEVIKNTAVHFKKGNPE